MEIWGYRSCGKNRFAIVNSKNVSKSIINTIDNRQTLGICEGSTLRTFSNYQDLKNHLNENNINHNINDRTLWSD